MSTSYSPAPTHPAPQALASPESPPSAAPRPHLLSSFRPFSSYGRQIKPAASARIGLADGKVRLASGAIVDRPRISVASHLAAFARNDAGAPPVDNEHSSWNHSSSRAASSVCKEDRVGGSGGHAMEGVEVAADNALVSVSEGVEAMQVEEREQVGGTASDSTMQKKSEAVASGGIDVGEAFKATGTAKHAQSLVPGSPSRTAGASLADAAVSAGVFAAQAFLLDAAAEPSSPATAERTSSATPLSAPLASSETSETKPGHAQALLPSSAAGLALSEPADAAPAKKLPDAATAKKLPFESVWADYTAHGVASDDELDEDAGQDVAVDDGGTWRPFTLAKPFLRLSEGLVARIPIEQPGTLLSDLPLQEQKELLMHVLESAQHDQRRFHHSLPPATPAGVAKLLPLAPALSADLLRQTLLDRPALPPATELNRRVAMGQMSALVYYVYLFSAWAHSLDSACAFAELANSVESTERAKSAAVDIYFDAYRQSLDREVKTATETKTTPVRVTGYTGYSDGFDWIPSNGKPYFRPANHAVGTGARPRSLTQLVLQLVTAFLKEHPGSIEVVLSIVGSGENLDDDLDKQLVGDTEAVASVAAKTAVTLGGTNVSACGVVNNGAKIVECLATAEPETKPADLDGDRPFPRSITLLCQQRHGERATCAEALEVAEQQKRERALHASSSPNDGSRKPSIRNRKFRHTATPKVKAKLAPKPKPKSAPPLKSTTSPAAPVHNGAPKGIRRSTRLAGSKEEQTESDDDIRVDAAEVDVTASGDEDEMPRRTAAAPAPSRQETTTSGANSAASAHRPSGAQVPFSHVEPSAKAIELYESLEVDNQQRLAPFRSHPYFEELCCVVKGQEKDGRRMGDVYKFPFLTPITASVGIEVELRGVDTSSTSNMGSDYVDVYINAAAGEWADRLVWRVTTPAGPGPAHLSITPKKRLVVTRDGIPLRLWVGTRNYAGEIARSVAQDTVAWSWTAQEACSRFKPTVSKRARETAAEHQVRKAARKAHQSAILRALMS
ncbi:hypothetical protein Rhopal_000847-T1 [Rhodotorula paludigena]|uniref:Uncharacterized protein n=1 Tax=Rhodotorula paludigena TaxID=86838 RepID=A0AAV5GFQ3_9BASI|nr:hypothetical protein Rhopal_000847-T1 [Rhodotorula paludigena]